MSASIARSAAEAPEHIATIRTSRSGLSHQARAPECGTRGPWRRKAESACDDSTRHEIMMILAAARDADERKMLAMSAGPDVLAEPSRRLLILATKCHWMSDALRTHRMLRTALRTI